MGDVLVRATRADDSTYLIWSTVVDGPVWIFSDRAEAEQHLNDQWRFSHPEYDADGHIYTPATVNARPEDPLSPAAKLARADLRGSSSMYGLYGWDDQEFVIMTEMAKERAPGTYLILPRERLQDFALALLEKNLEEAGLLLDVRQYED